MRQITLALADENIYTQEHMPSASGGRINSHFINRTKVFVSRYNQSNMGLVHQGRI